MGQFYYINIFLSEKDGKKYIGYTSNLDQRLKSHNQGEVASTKYRRPLKLIYHEALNSKIIEKNQ